MNEPTPGDVLLDRYRLERELGRGAQAVVFEARDLQLDRPVAVKVLAQGLAGRADGDWQGLLEEARLQAAVEAPGVARLVDALEDGEQRYLIMELVRGPGLQEVIDDLRESRLARGERPRSGADLARAAGVLGESPGDSAGASAPVHRSWDRAVAEFGASLTRSVSSLHARGLIHRDLKPSNIKLDGRGAPVVLDFGLARWLDAPASQHLQGTPGYMAPEQLHDGAKLDARTDVYQIGLILYELSSLERAYPAEALQDVSRFVELARAGRVRALRDANPHTDPGLAAVIHRALEPSPDERYESLTQLAGDLERVAGGCAPAHARTSALHRSRCFLRGAVRRPTVVAILAAAVLAPIAWGVRSALLAEVTSIEGWRFTPQTSSLFDIVSGSEVRVGDDLGIRVATSAPRTVYVLSIFGNSNIDQRLVSPMRPSPLVDGFPQANRSPRWGLRLEPGTHELVCTRIVDPNPHEGLLVFVTKEPSPLFEDWLGKLEQVMATERFGVGQELAFSLLEGAAVPDRTRGGGILSRVDGSTLDEEQLVRERERYSALSAEKASGREEWDLGTELIRYEVWCDVVATR